MHDYSLPTSERTGTGAGSWSATLAARKTKLIQALIAMSLKVGRRSGEDEQIEARIEQYAADLMAWPEGMALAVLAERPRRSAWWPAWKELEDLRAELEPRPEIRALPPPEHRPFERDQREMHQPFPNRREWDEFCDAMRKLRDPSVPMLGRAELLRIGESIEARQRPHAEQMGWNRP